MFDEAELLAAAGPTIFARGEDYVRYVHGLQVRTGEALASIQAKRVYTVRLTWNDRALLGECSCPHSFEGNFCKHVVAVGLAVLDGTDRPPLAATVDAGVRDYLDGLAHPELVELVVELVASDESALRLVQARAVGAGSSEAIDPAELTRAVSAALPTGFVDYRESFDVARDAQAMLDDLEQLLEAGAADSVRPALERATTRLRQVLCTADDSSGVLGDAGQRAAELHARACAAGRPDGAKLARWLVKFRADSPGWPNVDLAMYASALGEGGLTVYRAAVAKQAALQQGAGNFERFEVDRMLLELADHDGDLDEAVRLLSRNSDRVAFGAITGRLHAAGRVAESLEWLDRAVQAERIAFYGPGDSNDFWLAPVDVANRYLEAGRGADALAVLRNNFGRSPGPAAYAALLAVADRLDRSADERAWALEAAEQLAVRSGDGSALIRIAIAEHDLVAAWSANERFGACGAWRELAEASAEDLPFAAAQLYRPALDELLKVANTRAYPPATAMLVTIRDLYAKVGEQQAFAQLLADVRERYARRTSLLAALDRVGLR